MSTENQATNIVWPPSQEVFLKDIVRAENCHVYDSQGTRYVDLEAGVWCTVVGHGNSRIQRAIAEQAAQVSHTGYYYTSETVEDAAEEILSLMGFRGGKCVFLCSGSESVEYGVRVARSISDRPLLMTMTDSYFGAYGSAARKQEDEWYLFDWLSCAANHGPDGCDDSCEQWAAIPFDRIGGFVLEPGSSSGLVRFPPKDLVQRIVGRIRDNGGLVIINEVTTGVGRTGTWFGYQHYDISPDIVAIGKGIGNGYPVSVAVFAPGVIDRLGDRPVSYVQSHQNDPLGAAVAQEVVRVIRDEGLIERGREIAGLLTAGLEEIKKRTGKIRDVRGRGLMIAVEMKDDPKASYTVRTHQELVRRGFIVGKRPGINVFRIDPGLTIERRDIEKFLKTFEDILSE